MGLLDILNGMQNGPRGQSQQSGTGDSGTADSGGMSPITIALLGLLAYKGYKMFAGTQSASPGPGGQPPPPPGGSTRTAAGPAGGLGDILGGLLGGKQGGAPAQGQPGAGPGGLGDILGGLLGGKQGGAPAQGQPGASPGGLLPDQLKNILGGAAAGSVLSGGLGELLKGFQDSGHGKVAQSWVGTGPNQQIAPKDLAAALGGDTLDALTKQTGLKREELLSGLSQQLPQLVDQLTPDGRLPTDQEASRIL
jgi:uncharacterized protein YidB (DUF937 family)